MARTRNSDTRKWTKDVKKAIGAQGRLTGRRVPDHEVTIRHRGVEIRPDVVWFFKGKDRPRVIFEIDSSTANYKPVYGSLLNGVMIARAKKCDFVQVVRRYKGDSVGARIKPAMKLLKRAHRRVHLVEIAGTADFKNIHYKVLTELRKMGLAPKRKSSRKSRRSRGIWIG